MCERDTECSAREMIRAVIGADVGAAGEANEVTFELEQQGKSPIIPRSFGPAPKQRSLRLEA